MEMEEAHLLVEDRSQESGCLSPVLRLLSLCNKEAGPHWCDLHLVIVRLIDSLWSRGRILATTHLKQQKEFWSDLAHPLTSESSEAGGQDVKMMKIRAFVLRVLSHEVYTWSGNNQICTPVLYTYTVHLYCTSLLYICTLVL